MPSSDRRGTRIAHVGIAVRAIGDLLPFCRDILHLPEADLDNSDGARIVGLEAGESLVELLEADRPDTPVGRYIESRGPGIHHICFAVDDLDGTLDRCRSAGLRLIDEIPRVGAEGKRIAFIHPKSTGGILVELSEH
jgi:methylmalonyl-CoA epimerase